ncbi:hypothetical protein C4552_02375 [Candidatus Parcubacteria bacterium]|nr:MAG: hypothetical protein C4552_02375 [Candidatus Parcubacteria bacterium]
MPISIAFDAAGDFRVGRRLLTWRGAAVLAVTILYWSIFDAFWIRYLGNFPNNRIIATVAGVPIEEMLLFVLAFYNVAAILIWAKRNTL